METIKKLLINVFVLAMEKSFYFISDGNDYQIDDLVVVETTRGIELGKVVALPIEKDILETDEYPKVIKKGDQRDYQNYQANLEKGKQTIDVVQQEADKLGLQMKVVSCDFTLDNIKTIICYLADERVDFRELLKVLATILKCRIELKQIGTRDKAKMIGGIGICGLKLCCSTFLNEFDGISITMAKNQMLALNIPKLSGHCGKLICCLKYENDVYTELQKELPRIGTRVRYEDNIFKITSMNVITKMIRLENKDTVVTVPYDTIKDNLLPRDYPMNQPLPPKQEEAPNEENKPKEEGKPEQQPRNNNFQPRNNNNNNQNRNRNFQPRNNNGQSNNNQQNYGNRPHFNNNKHNNHFNNNQNRNGNNGNVNNTSQEGNNNNAKN